MHRAAWLFLLLLLLSPRFAQAIQLHWAGGNTDITISSNTQALLVVQADSSEATLPNSWRLQWTADSLGVQFSAFDPNQACLVDTAKVDSIAPPQTPADSAANQITAWCCSSGSNNAASAYFLADLIAGSQGKLKVVALNPADTTQVIESNEVTFNGGVGGDFAPLVLSATQSRSANAIIVTAIGTGLNLASEARIVSRDADWSVPLTTTSQSPTVMTAAAEVSACLPPAALELGGPFGHSTTALLSGDVAQAPAVAYSYGQFLDPFPGTRPKDFSFFYDDLGHFHLFFINSIASLSSLDPRNERYFGITKGTDLRDDWSTPDTLSFRVRGTGWESAHVWAPHMMQLGPTYYMFYTGLDAQQNQAIGVATTDNINPTGTNLISWSYRSSSPIISRDLETWIDPTGSAQCRDPFVMRGTVDSTVYWMLYSTQYLPTGGGAAKTTIGVAWQYSNALTQPWHDYGRLQVADLSTAEMTSRAESPHAFMHINARGDSSYYVCVTGDDAAFPGRDRLLRNRRSAWDVSADTTASHWNLISSVYDQLGFAQLYQYIFNDFNASEYCRMYNHEYLAGVNASPPDTNTYAIWITMLQWVNGGSGPDAMALLGPVSDVNGGGDHATGPRSEGLRLLGRSPGQWPEVLEMTLPHTEHVELTIYDVAGRAVRKLVDGTQLRGSVRVAWDGRSETGGATQSGVYFARMRCSGGAKVARIIVLR